jgi:hypothetical protein
MPNATLTKPENKASSKSKSMGDESMIVKLGNLDKMLELAGQVIIVSSNLNALGRQIHQGSTISRNVADDVKDLAITSSRISSDLHSLVSDVRTVGMGDLFARFRRLARDTSRRLGKAIKFEVEGEGINIDKKISEKIYDPIAHQIRNAIDHGIESSQRRIELGKDPVARFVFVFEIWRTRRLSKSPTMAAGSMMKRFASVLSIQGLATLRRLVDFRVRDFMNIYICLVFRRLQRLRRLRAEVLGWML